MLNEIYSCIYDRDNIYMWAVCLSIYLSKIHIHGSSLETAAEPHNFVSNIQAVVSLGTFIKQ